MSDSPNTAPKPEPSALKKALWPILALVFGALASYFATGCGVALPPEAKSAIDSAACAKAVSDQIKPYTTLGEAAALIRALPACFEPKAPAADAGAVDTVGH